jgi:rubredoxin-NAD+ reductase
LILNSANRIIIIGSGIAGFTLAREIRKLSKTVSVTIITKDQGYFYSKPLLSTALANKKDPSDLISSSVKEISSQLDINILSNTNVEFIDHKNNTLITSKKNISYDKLVLAIGANQIRVPIEGSSKDLPLTVNNLEEYIKFRNAITGKKNVTILGAGLIGCEFANDLVIAGFSVNVIDLANYPLSRLLPEEAGKYLQNKLADAGIKWYLNNSVKSINHVDDKVCIPLTNGTVLHSDVVLSAIGLKPFTDLAKASGISTGQGIHVNRKLQTNIPNVFALGDCAEVENIILPYIMPIMHSAKALAMTLVVQDTQLNYPAMPVMVKTPSLPTIVSPPAKDLSGFWRIINFEDGLEARFESSNGALQGFALLGSATSKRADLTKQLPGILFKS